MTETAGLGLSLSLRYLSYLFKQIFMILKQSVNSISNNFVVMNSLICDKKVSIFCKISKWFNRFVTSFKYLVLSQLPRGKLIVIKDINLKHFIGKYF